MLLYATSTLHAAACSPASKSVTFSCDVLVLRRMLLQLRLPLQERTESDPLAEAEHIKEEIDALEDRPDCSTEPRLRNQAASRSRHRT